MSRQIQIANCRAPSNSQSADPPELFGRWWRQWGRTFQHCWHEFCSGAAISGARDPDQSSPSCLPLSRSPCPCTHPSLSTYHFNCRHACLRSGALDHCGRCNVLVHFLAIHSETLDPAHNRMSEEVQSISTQVRVGRSGCPHMCPCKPVAKCGRVRRMA